MFKTFANAVNQQLDFLTEHKIFYTADVWETYLDSFPPGTNEIFRERREYDCGCCKHFVRNLGGLVAIVNGKLMTIWDIEPVGEPFDTVAKTMGDYVRTLPIVSPFLNPIGAFGQEESRELIDDSVHVWNHFSGNAPITLDAAVQRGEAEAKVHVFRRALSEFKVEDVSALLEVLPELYRGAEYQEQVVAFERHLMNVTDDLYIWGHYDSLGASIYNTAIGSMLQDLTKGVDIETAARAFEKKVAPENYKRSKSLITPAMIEHALAKVDELDLRGALERRHARPEDISINDVIFASAPVQVRDRVAELLMTEAKATGNVGNARQIAIEDFLRDVVPNTTEMQLLMEHPDNLVTLTAGDGDLFKWGGGIAWTYAGDLTDIKSRVAAAGGNVNVPLRVSLSWYNTDDLDLHMSDPSGRHIYYNNKCNVLDVDMNAGDTLTRKPVENMAFPQLKRGSYRIQVHNYYRREDKETGFMIQIALAGKTFTYKHDAKVTRPVDCGEIFIDGEGVTIEMKLPEKAEAHWGVKHGSLVPVDLIALSPNYWNGRQEGNKHYLFMLRGCRNPEPVRGVYNEFLRADLHEHRKVFEVLGDKMKAPYVDNQLSGVGFSSTQRASVKVLTQQGAFEVMI